MPAAALDQRLDHHRGKILVVQVQGPLQLVQVVPARRRTRHARRQTVAVRRGQADDVEQQRTKHLVKPRHAADADAAQRVAVVGFAQRQVLRLAGARVGTLPPVLEGHLQGDFDRRRTVAGEEHVLQAGRREFGQPLGQQDRGGVRQAQRRDVSHFVQLVADRLVQSRVTMPVDVAPQTADAVQVLAAVDIHQRAAVRRSISSGSYSAICVNACQTTSRSQRWSSSRVAFMPIPP